ncbi:MAG: type I glutamate--ammonia ligase [Anaerolineaceae bacterium]|nr:type I glutamate--ammonia ligase [Anaerolineaceae bacterium]
MFQDFDEAKAFIQEQGVRMVDLKYTDLWGRWHHVTVPVSQFTQELVEEGVGFDASSVGLKPLKSGDMVTVPDLSTGFMDPYWEAPTLSFLCSAREADSRKEFARDPRNIARRAEEYLRETGIAGASLWGPEFEFYVFDSVAFENEIHRVGYQLESSEGMWNSPAAGKGTYIPMHGGYHAHPPRDVLYNLRSEMCLQLEAMGVPIRYHHHEVGGPGQVEIETALMGLLESGDATMKVKYVAKMAAAARNQTATFMPKPLFGEAGNGMHFHQLLTRGELSLFYDPEGYACLSELALHYIGGLLTHGPALLALTNPSTNSFRRLVPGYEAPVNLFFSLGNRSAAVRIPKYANNPYEKRMEFRPPDATCNVYLALAAQLMAGLDGIRKKIDPTAAGFGPFDSNVFGWSEEERKKIKAVPSTLGQALEALADDHEFLLAGDVMDAEFIRDWIRYKMDREYLEVRDRPHPYEMALYFDV